MRTKRCVGFLMGFVFLGSLVFAQMPGERMIGRERLRENINRLRLLRMTEVLALTEEQTAKIYPAYYRVEKEKMELMKRLNSEIRELKDLLAGPEVKKEGIGPKIKAVKELRRSLVEKEQEFEDFLEQNLSDVQKAKYLVFSVEFYRSLGDKLKRARVVSRERGGA